MGQIRFTPGTVNDSVSHGDVVFSFGSPVIAGNFVDGPAWIVVRSGGVSMNEPTPAQTTYGGSLVNGCMVNPVVGFQGYDQRMMEFSAGLVASSWPRTVLPGDVIVKAVSREVLNSQLGNPSRAGVADSYGALFVLGSPPLPGSFAPAAVGWTGRGAPQPITLQTSIEDFVDSLPAFDMSVVPTAPPYDKIMERFDKWCPLGQSYNLMYEPLLPYGVGATSIPNNYGRDSGCTFHTAALSLLRSDLTRTQKIAIATRLVSWGIQVSDPSIGSGLSYRADGGHFTFYQSAAITYLHLSGQTSRLENFVSEQGGNFRQVFAVTQQMIDEEFIPHTDTSKSCTWRERPIVSVSGTTITYQAIRFSGNLGDTPHFNPLGLVIKRKSDGATARVVGRGPTYIAPINTPFNMTLTIDTQPTPAFAPGDVVWFEPPPGAELGVGDVDWRLIEQINSYNPGWAATYRDLNYFSAQVLYFQALNLVEAAGLNNLKNWVVRANQTGFPLADFDYKALFKTFVDTDNKNYTFDRDFWNAYWGVIANEAP